MYAVRIFNAISNCVSGWQLHLPTSSCEGSHVNISFGSSGFKPERFSFYTEPPDVPELRDDVDCIPLMNSSIKETTTAS